MRFQILLLLVAPSLGYKIFQDRIPNGGQIPHPCKPNYMWGGVGHLNAGGGGVRNSFGEDFERNGKKWDRCLCEKDSDGDGQTNGEELGDPLCVWQPGLIPTRTTGLTHPGVCEPFTDPVCQAENEKFGDFCSGKELHPCVDDIKAQPEMRVWNLTFPVTPVPAQVTTYMCQTFQFPETDRDYHAVAMQPNIDNEYVMHHMLLYGCTEDVDVSGTPSTCGMGVNGCFDLLFTWAVGANGQCLNENCGFKLGQTGYKKVVIQTHWNNPELVRDYRDGSGMVIYYTPNMRQYDGGSFMIGQTFIAIPPNQRDLKVEGTCESECTASYPHTMFITDTFIHMHYLGYKGYIYHNRGNRTVTDLVVQDHYSYDTPIQFPQDPPLEFLPGDEFHTVCHFKSTSRDDWTEFGDGTNDEMCFGFVTYYPKIPDLGRGCTQYMSHSLCGGNGRNDEDGMFLGCNQTWFWREDVIQGFLTPLASVCDPTGMTCTEGCRNMLDQYAEQTECFRGDHLIQTKHTLRRYNFPDVFRMIDSCAEKTAEDNWTDEENSSEDESSHEEGGLCDGDPSYPRPSNAPAAVTIC